MLFHGCSMLFPWFFPSNSMASLGGFNRCSTPCLGLSHMGFSINGGYPNSWMVDLGAPPYFRKPPNMSFLFWPEVTTQQPVFGEDSAWVAQRVSSLLKLCTGQTTRISGFTSLGNPRNDPTSRLQQNKQLWTPVRITPSLSVTSKALQVKPWTNPPRAFQIAWLVPKLPSLKLLKHWPQKGPVSYAHRSIIPPRIPPVAVPGFFLNFSLPIGPPSSAHFTSGPGEEQGSRHCQS